MEAQGFDRLTRQLAAPTRRGFLRGLGALAIGGFALAGFGKENRFRKALAEAEDPEERGVLLVEEIARIAGSHTGTCDELHRVFRDFQENYKDEIAAIGAEEDTWTKDQLRHHVVKYGDRRQAAAETITPVMERCNPDKDAATATPMSGHIRGGRTSDLAAVLGMGIGATRGLAQADSTGGVCTLDNYNFLVEGYCHKPGTDWASPVFQWPALCAHGDIDGDCDLCEQDFRSSNTKADICLKVWPQTCRGKDGNNICVVDYHWSHGGIATSICADRPADKVLSAKAECYSNESDWSSPQFEWEIFCPKGYGDSDCIDCGVSGGETSPGICEKYWPQDCHREDRGNICYVGFHYSHVDADCHDACPLSDKDCALSWLAGLTGEAYRCGACMSAWCGDEQHCMDRCVATGACDDECDDDSSGTGRYSPPDFPGGEGRTGGTPIPINHGTPEASPVVPPPLPPATPATPASTVVPPPLPPSTPVPVTPPNTVVPPPSTPNATPVG